MTDTKICTELSAVESEKILEMEHFEITCVATNSFHYRRFRYTTLDEAIAQAKRDVASVPPSGPVDRASPWTAATARTGIA